MDQGWYHTVLGFSEFFWEKAQSFEVQQNQDLFGYIAYNLRL